MEEREHAEAVLARVKVEEKKVREALAIIAPEPEKPKAKPKAKKAPAKKPTWIPNEDFQRQVIVALEALGKATVAEIQDHEAVGASSTTLKHTIDYLRGQGRVRLAGRVAGSTARLYALMKGGMTDGADPSEAG